MDNHKHSLLFKFNGIHAYVCIRIFYSNSFLNQNMKYEEIWRVCFCKSWRSSFNILGKTKYTIKLLKRQILKLIGVVFNNCKDIVFRIVFFSVLKKTIFSVVYGLAKNYRWTRLLWKKHNHILLHGKVQEFFTFVLSYKVRY